MSRVWHDLLIAVEGRPAASELALSRARRTSSCWQGHVLATEILLAAQRMGRRPVLAPNHPEDRGSVQYDLTYHVLVRDDRAGGFAVAVEAVDQEKTRPVFVGDLDAFYAWARRTQGGLALVEG